MSYDLLERRNSKFVLWIPGQPSEARTPQLLLGTFDPSLPATVTTYNQVFRGPLASTIKDLWELDPNDINPSLADGTYHYWFDVQDTSPENLGIVQVTDPIAYNVDYRISKLTGDKKQPASVIKFRDGKLWPCDRDGHEPGQATGMLHAPHKKISSGEKCH